jgi:hypothetical protein
MVTSVTKGGTQKLPEKFNILKTDMTIHWGSLSDGTNTIVVRFNHFQRKTFSDFFLSKNLSPEELRADIIEKNSENAFFSPKMIESKN